jgi:hypothetical protein
MPAARQNGSAQWAIGFLYRNPRPLGKGCLAPRLFMVSDRGLILVDGVFTNSSSAVT